jgi:hypothetical protein
MFIVANIDEDTRSFSGPFADFETARAAMVALARKECGGNRENDSIIADADNAKRSFIAFDADEDHAEYEVHRLK